MPNCSTCVTEALHSLLIWANQQQDYGRKRSGGGYLGRHPVLVDGERGNYFNAQLRYWQNYVGRPVCFSVYGQNTIYVGPVPDQAYVVEIDSTILPTALSLNTPNANDQIQDPYTTPVAFYAAYKAKYKEQSYGEAEIYKQEYAKQIQAVLNSVYTRRIPDPYSTF